MKSNRCVYRVRPPSLLDLHTNGRERTDSKRSKWFLSRSRLPGASLQVSNLSGPSPEQAQNPSRGDAVDLNFLLVKGTVAREILPPLQSLLKLESKVWAVESSRRIQGLQEGTAMAVQILPSSALVAPLPCLSLACHLSGRSHYGHMAIKDLWFFFCVCMFHFSSMGKDTHPVPPRSPISLYSRDLQAR